MKRDNAFTGLEAAIVLIAFVVVAAIFSYVLLGAGFFATQKAQEVTYAGIKQAVSNAVIDGGMYAHTVNDGNLSAIMFNVRIPLGGEAIDMNTTTFLFSSAEETTPVILMMLEPADQSNKIAVFNLPGAGDSVKGYYPDKDRTILTSGEMATFVVEFKEEIVAGQWFTLEMRPRIGAATLISKTLGSGLETGDIL